MPIHTKKDSPNDTPFADIIKDSDPLNVSTQLDTQDIERRLIHEYHRQNELFQMAQKAGLDNAMIPNLAVMNAIRKVLGYEPEEQ